MSVHLCMFEWSGEKFVKVSMFEHVFTRGWEMPRLKTQASARQSVRLRDARGFFSEGAEPFT